MSSGGCPNVLRSPPKSLPSPRRSGEKVPKADEGHPTEAAGQCAASAPTLLMSPAVILSVGGWSGGQSKDLLGTIEHRKKTLRLPTRPPTHAQDDTLVHLSLYRRSRRLPAQARSLL